MGYGRALLNPWAWAKCFPVLLTYLASLTLRSTDMGLQRTLPGAAGLCTLPASRTPHARGKQVCADQAQERANLAQALPEGPMPLRAGLQNAHLKSGCVHLQGNFVDQVSVRARPAMRGLVRQTQAFDTGVLGASGCSRRLSVRCLALTRAG